MRTKHINNDNGDIRDLVRQERECNAELAFIRTALIEGEASGKAHPFDATAFRQKMLTSIGSISTAAERA